MFYQRETLVAKLRDRGITYLAPSDAQSTEVIASDEDLVLALLDQPDPRLQLALVTLFIRQPELADCVPALVKKLSHPLALELKTLYMAAVYLQRLWRTRLSFYLGDIALLPDLYSDQLVLPPANERFGKVGLYALADAWAARSLYPFNRLASLNKTMDLFFEALKLESYSHESSPTG
jgi:hypothetical protein